MEYHACRSYVSEDGSNQLVFEVYWISQGERAATAAFDTMKQQVYDGVSDGIDPYPNSKTFGDDRIAFKYDIAETGADASFIVFRVGEFIAAWSALGTEVDALKPFRDYYSDVVESAGDVDPNELINLLLASESMLPGYSMTYEDVSSAPPYYSAMNLEGISEAESTSISGRSGTTHIDSELLDSQIVDGMITLTFLLTNEGDLNAPMVTVTVTCSDVTQTVVVSSNVGYVQDLEPGESETLVVQVPKVRDCVVVETQLS